MRALNRYTVLALILAGALWGIHVHWEQLSLRNRPAVVAPAASALPDRSPAVSTQTRSSHLQSTAAMIQPSALHP
jgi:hypothetical protein